MKKKIEEMGLEEALRLFLARFRGRNVQSMTANDWLFCRLLVNHILALLELKFELKTGGDG